MAILIDADVIIEAERGSFDLFRWLESNAEEEFLLAAITVAEHRHGVERATRIHRSRQERFLERVFQTFEVAPYTERSAFEHAKLWAELERKGAMIGAHDLILAAMALERGDAVATFNARHFALVESLRVIAPS